MDQSLLTRAGLIHDPRHDRREHRWFHGRPCHAPHLHQQPDCGNERADHHAEPSATAPSAQSSARSKTSTTPPPTATTPSAAHGVRPCLKRWWPNGELKPISITLGNSAYSLSRGTSVTNQGLYGTDHLENSLKRIRAFVYNKGAYWGEFYQKLLDWLTSVVFADCSTSR